MKRVLVGFLLLAAATLGAAPARELQYHEVFTVADTGHSFVVVDNVGSAGTTIAFNGDQCAVTNLGGTNAVYVAFGSGGTVTSSNGIRVNAGETLTFSVDERQTTAGLLANTGYDAVKAITGAGLTTSVRVTCKAKV